MDLDKPGSSIFAVLIGDKFVLHYEVRDVVYLIELGIIHPKGHIYSYDFHKWMVAETLKEVRKELSADALNRPLMKPMATPAFTPPPPPMTPHFSLYELLEERLSRPSEDENVLYLKNKIETLENSNDFLIRDQEDFEERVKAAKEKYQEQVYLNKKLKEKLIALSEEKQELEIRANSLDNTQSDHFTQLKQTQHRLKDALNENKRLASALRRLGEEKKKINFYVSDLEEQLNGALHGTVSLKNNLKKREGDLLRLKKREAKAKKLIENLGKYRESAEVEKQGEIDRLIGESFEVNNEPKWFIKRDGEEKGPYRFSDVRQWHLDGNLPGKTLIKKAFEKTFSRLEKVYEFNTRVFIKTTNKDGKKVDHYYIRRTDFRAPFYEVAQLTFEGESFRGHCTSLSIGGCFIELSKKPEHVGLNSILKCQIQTEYLSHMIDVQMIVKNTSDKKPYGLGCQFLDLSMEEKDAIEEFVDSYLESKESDKAA